MTFDLLFIGQLDQRPGQVLNILGFVEEKISASQEVDLAILRLGVGGQDGHNTTGLGGFDIIEDRYAIAAWHPDIKDDEIRLQPPDFQDSLRSIPCPTDDLESARLGQKFFQPVSDDFGIISNENFKHGGLDFFCFLSKIPGTARAVRA